MNKSNGGGDSALMCWGLAALAAALAFVLLLVLGDWRVIQAIFAAGVIFVGLGLAMSWLFCRPLPAPAGTSAPKAHAAPDPAEAATPEPAPEPVQEASAPEPAQETPAPKVASAEPAEPLVKPSAKLAGEEDLAKRKGSWTYTPESDSGEAEGVKPALLQAAPADGGDDLQQIKGIGPKLAETCNSLGIYHFAQIAAWSEAEVAWVDSNIEGFKGRVTRDDWVAQAKALSGSGAG